MPNRTADILEGQMRFEVSHPFEASAERVAAAMFDASFQETLTDIGDLHDRSVLSVEEADHGKVTRKVRCVLALEMSGMARSMLGDSDPAWVQEEHWDANRMHCEWTIHPEVAGDLLSAAGTIDIEPADGKAIRSVAGDIKVRVPLYGGKVERWIVDGVSRAYAEEADLLARWLEREK
jgi:hypothetical protein